MEVQSRKMPSSASERWSLNSHHYPSGRFRKVSIGIAVEKSTKLGSGIMKDDSTALPIPEKLSSQERVPKENWVPLIVDKHIESATAKVQVVSAKLSTRSTCHEAQIAEPVHIFPEEASDLHLDDNMLKKMNATAEGEALDKHQKPSTLFTTKSTLHETLNAEKVQYFVNQTPVPQSEVCTHQRNESIFMRKKVGEGASSERPELVFTPMKEMHVFDASLAKEKSDTVNKHHSETLRMKLAEILGNASQNKQTIYSPNPEDTSAHASQKSKMQKAEVVEIKQNSDTIETDSESPKETIRRPCTRSLSRNKAPSRTVKKKMCLSPGSDPKKKVQKSIFAFDEDEGKTKTLSPFVNGNCNSTKGKATKHKKFRIEPRRIHFPQQPTSENNSLSKEKEIPSPDKAYLERKKRSSSFLPFYHEKDNLQTPNEVSNAGHHLQKEGNKPVENPSIICSTEIHELSSCLKMKTSSWDCSESKAHKETYSRGVSSSTGEKAGNQSIDFHSPTFAINANKSSCKSKILDEDNSPIVSEERIPKGKACRSEDLSNYKLQNEWLSAETESSEDSGEACESPSMKFSDEGEENGKQSSVSPSEQQESAHFETNEFLNEGFKPADKWFSNASEPTRKQVHTDKKRNQSNLSTSPPCGTSKTEETENAQIHDILEQFPEDSLARTVCQLALFLQSFKNKMKLRTKKKSSEILLAAAQNASSLINNAKTQVSTDVGKFLSSEKSKRKQLESKVEDHQKRMKIIHDKFKEDINQHLIHCKDTLNEMEAYHVELKGCMDRQKAAHGKLLQQVEKSIGSHLSDAETRITALHKEASKTMNGLQHALKGCMEDQI